MPVPVSAKPEVKRHLLKDAAYDAIRAAILDGSFAPGEQLDDRALQDWLGISRTPIRDALMTLAADGLVDIAPQAHTKVVEAHPEVVEANIQTLGVVMGGAIRTTVPGVSSEQRENMIARTAEALDAIERRDARGHLDATLRLYDLLVEYCPNPVLSALVSRSIVRYSFQIRLTIDVREPNWELLNSGWTRLRDGLRDSDPVAAELAFEEMHRLPLVTSQQWAPATWVNA